MAKDPVCGMTVYEKEAVATAVYKGTTYYFCATACKEVFEREPEKFISQSVTSEKALRADLPRGV